MFSQADSKSPLAPSLDPLDRIAIVYLALPLVIFLIGWMEAWAALPLVACVAYALRSLAGPLPPGGTRLPITRLQLTIAVAVGCTWTVLGGTGHFVFANADWHIRDAVLHDLVVSPWPVGYGLVDGKESLLRAPLAYFLPAALVGKWAGLMVAHLTMAAWTAMGATLFLLQVLSLTPSRMGVAVAVAAVIVFFSGFDIIGSIINIGPRFFMNWSPGSHIERWAGSYQYSSMTTQLFWVPNHALCGWLIIGLLSRDGRGTPLDSMLPILVVTVALWSPLSALGVVPFVLWKAVGSMYRERSLRLMHPAVLVPAFAVGIVVAGYLALDLSHIPKGVSLGRDGFLETIMDLSRQAQFFLLEAGFIGFAILAIRWSSEVVLALAILAVLPVVYLGPGNDLVMRASIPSLAVLAIGACLALSRESSKISALRKKRIVLCVFLTIGAVTPAQEIARTAVLSPWPINLQASLIAAGCGQFRHLPHYVARLGSEPITVPLRQPHRLAIGPLGPQSCDNPALLVMWYRNMW